MAEQAISHEVLKKKRAAFKGQLTYFKGQYDSASTLGSIESLLRRIQLVYDKYSAVQAKLEEIDDSTAVDRESFEDDYGKLESTILNKVHELKRLEDNAANVSFQNSSMQEASPASSPSIGIRLPELKLPLFSGAEAEWLSFRDLFVDLIHSKNIEASVKFAYLISHIRLGSAYKLIENLPVTAENYQVAWKTLCDRFNNKILIQKMHMRELYEIKGPLENSPKSLQRFIDDVLKHHNALKSLKINVDEWDLLLLHHLIQKLDQQSRVDVIKNSKPTVMLRFNDFVTTLRNRVQMLHALQPTSSHTTSHQTSHQHRPPRRASSSFIKASSFLSNATACAFCQGTHSILQCPSFTSEKISPMMRFQFVRDNRLCTNCLGPKHAVRDCRHPPCKLCSLKHNVILHFKTFQSTSPSASSSTFKKTASTTPSVPSDQATNSNSEVLHAMPSTLRSNDCNTSKFRETTTTVLIGTALVNATTPSGNNLMCRALLDSGSHMNFITNEACNILKARKQSTSKTITGIGGKESTIKYKSYLTISSRVSSYSVELKFYVIPKITNAMPPVRSSFKLTSVPAEIELADPAFNVPDRIDLLLGVEIYHQLFKGDSVKVCKELPPFYNTELGYVVCGRAECEGTEVKRHSSQVILCSIQTLEAQLKQFWEMETISVKSTYSLEEKLCEQHYCSNTTRLPGGRYSVALPTKSLI